MLTSPPPALASRRGRTFRPTLACVTDLYPSASVDGFELGMFVASNERGDAWVKAPDGSIATLIWQTGAPSYFKVAIESNEARWGTFAVQLPLPMTNDDEAGSYLSALLLTYVRGGRRGFESATTCMTGWRQRARYLRQMRVPGDDLNRQACRLSVQSGSQT
jgi:hypothetical protein